jgi:hypothetical protein
MRRRRALPVAVCALIAGFALAGGCTTPPVGYQGAGRMQELPGLVTDATDLVIDGAEVGPPMVDATLDALDGGPGMLTGLCVPGGVVCHYTYQCCAGSCTATGGNPGYCTGPNTDLGKNICATAGISCVTHSDCCDNYCGNSVCSQTTSPICVPTGIICHATGECCGAAGPDATMTNDDSAAGQVCTDGACGFVLKGASGPLCAPLGVKCVFDSDCCIGQCIVNGSLEHLCLIPHP